MFIHFYFCWEQKIIWNTDNNKANKKKQIINFLWLFHKCIAHIFFFKNQMFPFKGKFWFVGGKSVVDKSFIIMATFQSKTVRKFSQVY